MTKNERKWTWGGGLIAGGLSAAALVGACSLEADRAPDTSGSSSLPQAEEIGEDCSFDAEEEMVLVTFPQLQAGKGAVAISSTPLQVRIASVTPGRARLIDVSVRVETELDEWETRLASLSLSSGDAEVLEVDLASSELDRGALNFSGTLQVRAAVHNAEGEVESEIVAGASVHPEGEAWLVYDEETKVARFADGRLSERARSILMVEPIAGPSFDSMGRRTPLGEKVEQRFVMARVVKVSDTDNAPQGKDD